MSGWAISAASHTARSAEPEEVMQFMGRYQLMGRGLGYVDVHLLVSARLTKVSIWTLDKRLRTTASELGLEY